jgi:hypothetical protein
MKRAGVAGLSAQDLAAKLLRPNQVLSVKAGKRLLQFIGR